MSFVYSHPFTGLANGLNTMQGGGAVGGWVELGRTTLGGTSDTITVSSLSDKRYYMVLHSELNSGQIQPIPRLNGDSGNNYAHTASRNGGADDTNTSVSSGRYIHALSADCFGVNYIANRSANEKLNISHCVSASAAGEATAPEREEIVWKWVNTSSAINRIDSVNAGSGDFASGSEVVVLGWDPADTHTNNFWEELASVDLGVAGDNLSSGTITAKKYLWVQAYLEDNGSAIYSRLSFNNDAASGNYAFRRSYDGAADATGTSQNNIADLLASATYPHFVNMFIINNSSEEKLVIGHTIGQNTAGAANAPLRTEFVAKWNNTSNQITEIDIDNTGAGSYDTNSKIRVWGAN